MQTFPLNDRHCLIVWPKEMLKGHTATADSLSEVNSVGALVVGQFAVAALYKRRNLLNQKPAVIDRRYK
jgi:hypothetical protein